MSSAFHFCKKKWSVPNKFECSEMSLTESNVIISSKGGFIRSRSKLRLSKRQIAPGYCELPDEFQVWLQRKPMTPVKTLNNVPEVVWNFAHPEMGTKLRQQSVAFFAFVTVWSLLQFSAGPLSAEAAIMLNGSIIFAFLLGVMIWREPATHLFIINKGCFIEAVVVDRPICTKGLDTATKLARKCLCEKHQFVSSSGTK